MFSSTRVLFFVLVLLLVFCSVLSESETAPFKPAPNCAYLECPAYTVVHTDKDFEIRSYHKSTWVVGPSIESNSYTEASNKGFLILFDYFNGNNYEHVKVNMTAPVVVGIQNSTYQVFFYVPKVFQTYVPRPLSNDISRVTLPQFKYAAVRRFGGFLSDQTIPKELDALKKSLQPTPYQKAINDTIFAVNGYNSPFELFNRVNEIVLAFN